MSIENDSEYSMDFNNPVLVAFRRNVEVIVNSYYGIGNYDTSVNRYDLQYSTVIGVWNGNYSGYNCYAYALQRTNGWFWPGAFSTLPNPLDFNVVTRSIYTMACDVKSDLQSSTLSKQCVIITTVKPSSLASGQSCICIRKGDSDFHFMRMSGVYWNHKPAASVPLRYNYTNPSQLIWNNERVEGGVAIGPDVYYDSAIYYILYKTTHNTSHIWTGEQYHIGAVHKYKYKDVCSLCGDVIQTVWETYPCSGPPCQLIPNDLTVDESY